MTGLSRRVEKVMCEEGCNDMRQLFNKFLIPGLQRNVFWKPLST